MTAFVALLRGVNVGGAGKLAMAELRAAGVACGFRDPRTFIASGNLVFGADGTEAEVRAALEGELACRLGRPVTALVRTGRELEALLAANPFPSAPGARVIAVFLPGSPSAGLLDGAAGRADEEIAADPREVIIHYPSGQGASKLRLPAAAAGTGRNMNTVAALSRMARG